MLGSVVVILLDVAVGVPMVIMRVKMIMRRTMMT